MATTITGTSVSGTLVERIKQGLFVVALMAVSFLVALYLVAPRMAQAEAGYLPQAISSMPVGIVHLTNPDGVTTFLPVRLAETAEARQAGLRGVGPSALDHLFLLYAHPRELTRSSYNTEGIRAPLELAVIDAQGNVIEIRKVASDSRSITVTERHRWVLAAKDGALAHYGITPETVLDPEAIRKLN